MCRNTTTIHLGPNDHPRALAVTASGTVWVNLDHQVATGTATAAVFPYSAEQAEALAVQFQEAAALLRAHQDPTVRAALAAGL